MKKAVNSIVIEGRILSMPEKNDKTFSFELEGEECTVKVVTEFPVSAWPEGTRCRLIGSLRSDNGLYIKADYLEKT